MFFFISFFVKLTRRDKFHLSQFPPLPLHHSFIYKIYKTYKYIYFSDERGRGEGGNVLRMSESLSDTAQNSLAPQPCGGGGGEWTRRKKRFFFYFFVVYKTLPSEITQKKPKEEKIMKKTNKKIKYIYIYIFGLRRLRLLRSPRAPSLDCFCFCVCIQTQNKKQNPPLILVLIKRWGVACGAFLL